MKTGKYCFTVSLGILGLQSLCGPSVHAQSHDAIEVKTDPAVSTKPPKGVMVLKPTRDWKVSAKADRCSLSRKFGLGENEVLMRMEKGGPDTTFNLSLFGQPLRYPIGPVISLQFGPGQEAFGRNYLSVKSTAGRPALMMFGTSYAAAVKQEDGTYTALKPSLADFAEIQYLQVERAGLKSFRLDFDGSLANVAEAMNECTSTLAGRLQVSATGQSRPPLPVGNPGQWVVPRDYPSMMLRYKKEGHVRFRLTINREGKPTFCTIDRSTLPQMFDNAVCVALLKKARFKPSLDWEGNPVESYWRSGVRFEVRG